MGELRGVVLGYRRGSNTQYTGEMLLRVDGITSRGEASRLIGRRVIYVDAKGNTYRGKIIGVHGNRGTLRAVFKPNLPGQSIGSVVRILEK